MSRRFVHTCDFRYAYAYIHACMYTRILHNEWPPGWMWCVCVSMCVRSRVKRGGQSVCVCVCKSFCGQRFSSSAREFECPSETSQDAKTEQFVDVETDTIETTRKPSYENSFPTFRVGRRSLVRLDWTRWISETGKSGLGEKASFVLVAKKPAVTKDPNKFARKFSQVRWIDVPAVKRTF